MHGDRCNPFLHPCPLFAVPPSPHNFTPPSSPSRLQGQAGRSALPSCLLTSEGSDVTMKRGWGGRWCFDTAPPEFHAPRVSDVAKALSWQVQ